MLPQITSTKARPACPIDYWIVLAAAAGGVCRYLDAQIRRISAENVVHAETAAPRYRSVCNVLNRRLTLADCRDLPVLWNFAVCIKPQMLVKLVTGLFLIVAIASPQDGTLDTGVGASTRIPLVVPAGVPLRLYLTKRVPKRPGAPVEAKLLTPLYAFDREVIPAGTRVLGHVSRLQPVSRWQRLRAVLGGDFTPLHIAQIEFTSLVVPDGRHVDLHTAESPGLNSLVPVKPPKQKTQSPQVQNSGILGTAKQKAKDQIDAQVARVRSIPDLVRGTDKKEWLYDYAMSRLPYHPQSVRNRTRFDAVLKDPLEFGAETVTWKSLALLGSQPAPGSIVHARLLTSVDSERSKPGDKIEAALEQPLFSSDHKVVLPEGTLVEGTVVVAKKAGWFHRAGRLRFTFQSVELAPQVAELRDAALKTAETTLSVSTVLPAEPKLQIRTQGTLSAAEGGNAPVKVDSEGGVQAQESKSRFIGTAIALLITHRAADNDAGRSGVNGNNPNVSGRTLGGGLGFGLLGSIAAQASNNVGMALGYYGMGWAVFSTVVARGADVQFGRNAVIDIGFNQRSPAK